MQATKPLPVPPAEAVTGAVRRLVIYATSRLNGRLDDFIPLALESLREHADRLIVVACGEPDMAARATLTELADVMLLQSGDFNPGVYPLALSEPGTRVAEFDEIVLTGDSWFGSVGAGFAPVLERMAAQPVHLWEMVENRQGVPPAFPEQGFPARLDPWTWTVARRSLVESRAWQHYWDKRRPHAAAVGQESDFARHFRSEGFATAVAFAADDFSNDDPALFTPELLLAAGCPLLKRLPFTLYPPYLHQHAVIGRDIITALGRSGYPLEPFWQHLVRTVPSKALNTNAGMLEIVAGSAPAADAPSGLRIVAVVHVIDVGEAPEVFTRLVSLPAGYDLVVTTSDGRKAVELTRLLENRGAAGAASVDVRVTPNNRGRDMSDFFIACRDVLASDKYDLVVKLHARPMRRQTVNVRRHFRRFQLENLLASPQHVAGILDMFDREPGLGLVFPPMMHIGFASVGRAWAGFRHAAEKLHDDLGISVPLDAISPLAPFGGMWIARPAALRLLSGKRWLYRDYGKPGNHRYLNLARRHERVVVSAAAELGYHSRTVLAPEHASIGHTALEFKADQLFSTTRGYPVDSIRLIQRAGPTGYGGIVGLSRMYLRLNHPLLSRLALPLLAGAQWAYSTTRALMGDERFIRERAARRGHSL